KAKEIGLSLILSPLFGFGAAALLMWFLKDVVRSKALFHIPKGDDDTPPILIRLLLITTCTLVSFFHGSNDGQKGVGLLMLILIAFLPAQFAVNHSISNDKILASLNKTEQVFSRNANSASKAEFAKIDSNITMVKTELASSKPADSVKTYKFR